MLKKRFNDNILCCFKDILPLFSAQINKNNIFARFTYEQQNMQFFVSRNYKNNTPLITTYSKTEMLYNIRRQNWFTHVSLRVSHS